MLAYQKITVYKDPQKGKIVVENNSNTFVFDCTMEEASEFFKKMIEEAY